MGIGEWAGLTAAFLWTLSSMLWGKINLTAMGINLCKNLIGIVLISIHVLIAWWIFQPQSDASLASVSATSWGWLAASGLIGIVIGDTLYFRSLQILGPRRALMMATTGPIFSAVLGWLFLRESLYWLAIVGILMTVGGVVVVVADRKAAKEAPGLMPGRVRSGIATGLLGAICQAVGGVLSKLGMNGPNGEQICSAIDATFIRLLVAAIATTLIVVGQKKLFEIGKRALKWDLLKLLVPATALGTWLGIWCSQLAYQHSNVAVAQTLLATCPLFAIPIVWLFHKHRVTAYSILGTLIALVGVALVVRNS